MILSKLDLANIIEAQVKKQLDRFKESYNKANTASYVDYNVVVQEDKQGCKVDMAITLIIDGEANMLFSTRYGFRHPDQMKDEGEWMLTIWNEAQYNLIGGGIAYALNIAQQRKTTQHG